MKRTPERKAELLDFAEWKKATARVTVDCQLEPLNPVRLTSCVGWGEEALIDYMARRDWLRMHQEKIRQWVKYSQRTSVQVKVCRSLWKSYQFYVTILDSLIKHSNLFIKGEIAKQPPLFDITETRKGALRYVRH